MDDLDDELLGWLERENTVFRPVEANDESHREFQETAQRVLDLRARRLIHVAAAHISRTEAGDYLLVGPCTRHRGWARSGPPPAAPGSRGIGPLR